MPVILECSTVLTCLSSRDQSPKYLTCSLSQAVTICIWVAVSLTRLLVRWAVSQSWLFRFWCASGNPRFATPADGSTVPNAVRPAYIQRSQHRGLATNHVAYSCVLEHSKRFAIPVPVASVCRACRAALRSQCSYTASLSTLVHMHTPLSARPCFSRESGVIVEHGSLLQGDPSAVDLLACEHRFIRFQAAT